MNATQFWAAAEREASGCWTWKLSRGGGNQRYGHLKWQGRVVYAHRLAWILTHAKEPAKGNHIAHMCGNTLCINPAHLYEATPRENSTDIALQAYARGGKVGGIKRLAAILRDVFAQDAATLDRLEVVLRRFKV
jgi:hypothetical protein